MRNFLKIAEGLDVTPVLAALAAQPSLWNETTLRTDHPGSAHGEVDDIFLWFDDLTGDVVNSVQTHPYPAWSALPQVHRMVLDLMHRVDGTQLGRVIVTRLAPGRKIAPHTDGGAPATFYTRFQVALQSLPGAVFRSGGEAVNFRSGEVWMVNNRVEHSVENGSADDRIVIIVDIRTVP